MTRKKLIFHTKGKPTAKDLILVDGLNEEGKPAMDICPVSPSRGFDSLVVTDVKRWARLADIRTALKKYERFCCWNKYPENKPTSSQVYQWFLVARKTDKPWRKEKYIFDTDQWDGKNFCMTDKTIVWYLPIIPLPKEGH